MKRVYRAVWVAVLAAACARELPSTRPLGVGPLAGSAAVESPAPKKATLASEGEREPTKGEAPEPAVAATDAGRADAQPLAATDAGSKKSEARPSAGATVSFVGDFHGKDTNILRVPGKPPLPPMDDPKARVTVTEERDKRLAFALYGEGGNVACTLYATASGNTASFSPGQTCLGGKLASGTARIDGDTLMLELVLGDLPMDEQTAATLEYRFEGRRRK